MESDKLKVQTRLNEHTLKIISRFLCIIRKRLIISHNAQRTTQNAQLKTHNSHSEYSVTNLTIKSFKNSTS